MVFGCETCAWRRRRRRRRGGARRGNAWSAISGKGQGAFHASQHRSSKLTSRRCVDSPGRRQCFACEIRRYEGAFTPYLWERAGNYR
eukprot:3019968-Pyramimonas_sp.AAC.1